MTIKAELASPDTIQGIQQDIGWIQHEFKGTGKKLDVLRTELEEKTRGTFLLAQRTRTHEPHCPVPRSAARGEGAVCQCRQQNYLEATRESHRIILTKELLRTAVGLVDGLNAVLDAAAHTLGARLVEQMAQGFQFGNRPHEALTAAADGPQSAERGTDGEQETTGSP